MDETRDKLKIEIFIDMAYYAQIEPSLGGTNDKKTKTEISAD
jgi:hypothetical protein